MIKRILKEKADKTDELYRMEFFCDGEADVVALPTQNQPKEVERCSTGSLAYILTPDEGKSRLRILTSLGIWKEVGA